jgi:hypothetical protein
MARTVTKIPVLARATRSFCKGNEKMKTKMKYLTYSIIIFDGIMRSIIAKL